MAVSREDDIDRISNYPEFPDFVTKNGHFIHFRNSLLTKMLVLHTFAVPGTKLLKPKQNGYETITFHHDNHCLLHLLQECRGTGHS